MNYGDTREKFKTRLRRRDVTDTVADGFLEDSVTRIQRVIRTPAGEKSALFTMDDVTYFDAGRLPIPDDYLQLKNITITSGTTSRVLSRQPLEKVLDLVSCGAQGTTYAFCRQGGAWIFGPLPLSGDTARVDYYSEYEEAETPADETILLNIANDLVIYGALSYACEHFNDPRADRFEQRFTQVLSDIQAQASDDELMGDAQVSSSFEWPSDW